MSSDVVLSKYDRTVDFQQNLFEKRVREMWVGENVKKKYNFFGATNTDFVHQTMLQDDPLLVATMWVQHVTTTTPSVSHESPSFFPFVSYGKRHSSQLLVGKDSLLR